MNTKSDIPILSNVPNPNIAPSTILEMQEAYLKTQILISALDLDLFTIIGDSKVSSSELANIVNVNERAIKILSDALCSCGLLLKRNSQYKLTEESKIYLQKSSPFFIGDAIAIPKEMRHIAESLTDVLVSGKSVQMTDNSKIGENYFLNIAKILFKTHYLKARDLFQKINISYKQEPYSVIDIACGAAPWSIAFAEKYPHSVITAIDFEKTIKEITIPFLSAYNVENQFKYCYGSIRDINFLSEEYDIAILGHILHSEGPFHSNKLIQKTSQALKSDGLIIIAEMLTSDDHTSPWYPIFFGINMLINTQDGNTYSFNEIKTWLQNAGFINIEQISLNFNGSPIIIGTKK